MQNQQASGVIESGFEVFAQTPEYCAHDREHRDAHNISLYANTPKCLDSLDAATSVLARATCSDKDTDRQLRSKEYEDSVAAVGCVDIKLR